MSDTVMNEASAAAHQCQALRWGERCSHPGQQRLIPTNACLAGAQYKIGARAVWLCEECWTEFQAEEERRTSSKSIRSPTRLAAEASGTGDDGRDGA